MRIAAGQLVALVVAEFVGHVMESRMVIEMARIILI